MIKLSAFVAGLVFGLGLLLAGMANPAKVLAFLDVTGAWDPSLALVMVGAIAVAAAPLNWARTRRQSLLGAAVQLPTKRGLDTRLIVGSLLFGAGWGIAGICPGPAVAVLLTGHWQIVVFFIAVLAGMYAFTRLESWRGQ
ncbi:DUF6691 family protein [Pseudomonas sp. S36]|uniref:DUF6691 family protein n=1 Tax=Pseudomonas sp. S36 TaxID=2767447 RepID=UPI001912681D|nr:DUF6691 family protein [Pseudomonas sp. S36]MBK4988004.1 membrane protein [Pseudomonas sp. S36]